MHFLFLILLGCKARPRDFEQANNSDGPSWRADEGTIVTNILIPMLASDSASHNVSGLIFNGLVKYDTDLSVIGDLAEAWDISKDGLVITFHLRKGVKWADGVEFTADDVMFGYKTIIDEKRSVIKRIFR
jgi:peptide/nickel transport system substrate-binding protein